MNTSEFDYNLPKELIAKEPAKPRDSAKLLVYNRLNKRCVHEKFYNIDKYLQRGDVLVLNNTRVIPARLVARRIDQSGQLGRKFKILLLEKKNKNTWTALIDGRGREIGLNLFFSNNLNGRVSKKLQDGIWEIEFSKTDKELEKSILKFGKMPLPPYIKQESYNQKNKEWYQTVYAKHTGSVAAPTAGLHFTDRLLKKLKKKGVQIEYVTLHVGMGTFIPVKTEDIVKHKMHK